MRKLISLFILLLVTSSAWAKLDYWVWVGKNGVTNYAAHRPDGVTNARHVTTATPFGERRYSDNGQPSDIGQNADNAGATSGQTAAGPVNPDAAIAKQKAAIRSQIADIRRKNCEMGKNRLAKLESYAHIRVLGKDGKSRLLTEKEHQQRIQQAKHIIRQNCST